MTLDGDRLGDSIESAVDAISLDNPMTAGQKTQLYRAIGNSIVSELTSNAVVPVNVASVSLVTPGVGASGPGTGTGTIT